MKILGVLAICLLASMHVMPAAHAGGGGIGKGTIIEDPEDAPPQPAPGGENG